MEKNLTKLIPPNAENIIEFVGGDSDLNSKLKENYLLINPTCNYKVCNDLNFKSKKVDVVIVSSSAFATLNKKNLTALMNKVADFIKDDGTIYFILENVCFAENIIALLNGEAPKFKVTIKFDDVREATEESKITITKAMQSTKDVVVPKILAELSKAPLNVTHFIIQAVKNSFMSKIKNTLIQSYLGEVLVCANIRVNEPNKFISTNLGVAITSSQSGQQLALTNDPKYQRKIFINQRVSANNFEGGIYLFNELTKRNYLFIEEIDDNPILWRQKYEETQFINFVGVHGVQTSTDSLADFFKQFNPNVRVFKNQLTELPIERNFAEEIKSNQPVTIFFGALNRDKDFYELLPAINKIATEYGDKIQFKVIAKTELFNSIQTPNKIFIGKREVYNGQYVPYDVYVKELHTTHIALLPLRNNIFNRSKSDLKFIECAGNGSVVLASPTVYSESVKDGETGFIYHDVKDFYQKLKMLIENKTKRIQVAKNAYEYVKHNRLLSQHYQERWDWYNELLAKLPELNLETQKRIEILKSKGYQAFGGFGEVNEKIDVFSD